MPLDPVVVYREMIDVGDLSKMPHCMRCNTEAVRNSRYWPVENKDRNFQHQFSVLCEVYDTRDFHLALCADVFDCMVEYGIERLERIVEAEMVARGPLQKPLIISESRTTRSRNSDHNMGWSAERPSYACAL